MLAGGHGFGFFCLNSCLCCFSQRRHSRQLKMRSGLRSYTFVLVTLCTTSCSTTGGFSNSIEECGISAQQIAFLVNTIASQHVFYRLQRRGVWVGLAAGDGCCQLEWCASDGTARAPTILYRTARPHRPAAKRQR